MPNFNGKGPEGQGSQTGRGLGKCNQNSPDSDNIVAIDARPARCGRGRGRNGGCNRTENAGRGHGRGMRRSDS